MESSLCAAAGWPGPRASQPSQWPFLLPVPPCCHSPVLLALKLQPQALVTQSAALHGTLLLGGGNTQFDH